MVVTAESIKNKILGKDKTAHTLIEVFKEHNRKIAALVGKEFANGTLERYETSLRHTNEFLKCQYGVLDIDIRKVDHSFISEYDFI